MKFSLGSINVKKEAALALEIAGQEITFFVEKHASGDWGNGDADMNEKGLRERSMVWSQYRTLVGHELHVITFIEKGETCVFVPPNSVSRHEALPDFAMWYPGGTRPDEEVVMTHQGGNGSGKFNILSDDMGGWVRVHSDMKGTVPADLSLYLSTALTDWFRQRPAFRLRCVVPISRDGNTVELHAWFDAHVFPPTSSAPPPVKVG